MDKIVLERVKIDEMDKDADCVMDCSICTDEICKSGYKWEHTDTNEIHTISKPLVKVGGSCSDCVLEQLCDIDLVLIASLFGGCDGYPLQWADEQDKWEVCTRENTKVGDKVRDIEYNNRILTVAHISKYNTNLILDDDVQEYTSYFRKWEINTNKKEKK